MAEKNIYINKLLDIFIYLVLSKGKADLTDFFYHELPWPPILSVKSISYKTVYVLDFFSHKYVLRDFPSSTICRLLSISIFQYLKAVKLWSKILILQTIIFLNNKLIINNNNWITKLHNKESRYNWHDANCRGH